MMTTCEVYPHVCTGTATVQRVDLDRSLAGSIDTILASYVAMISSCCISQNDYVAACIHVESS